MWDAARIQIAYHTADMSYCVRKVEVWVLKYVGSKMAESLLHENILEVHYTTCVTTQAGEEGNMQIPLPSHLLCSKQVMFSLPN